MINTLWGEWFKMWEDQNQDRHGSDAASRAQAQKKQALRELSQLYDWKPFISPANAKIFSTPLAEMQAKPMYQIIHFINQWKTIILTNVHNDATQ